MAYDGSIKIDTSIDGRGFQAGLKSLGSMAAKGLATITAAVGAGVVALGKQAVSAYADYEQLVGGVETLFKNSASLVEKYADNAFKTAGMSANTYMENVTSFPQAFCRVWAEIRKRRQKSLTWQLRTCLTMPIKWAQTWGV